MSETGSDLILATAPSTESVNPFSNVIRSAAMPAGAMKYTSAKLGAKRDDADKDSFYIVYGGENCTSGEKDFKIIEKFEYEELDFPVKSAQGWSKTGITLFRDTYYGGEGAHYEHSHKDVSTTFISGIQSFIVRNGVWQLKNSSDKVISIGGKNKFGPIDAITNTQPEQKNIKSIERIQD